MRFLAISLIFILPTAFAQAPSSQNAVTLCNQVLTPLLVGKHQSLSTYLFERARFADKDQKVVAVALAADESTHPFLTIATEGKKTTRIIDPFANRAYPGTTVTLSRDGNYGLFLPPPKYASHPILYDVRLDRFRHLKPFAKASIVDVAAESRFVIAKLADASLGVYDIASEEIANLKIFEGKWRYNKLGRSHQLLVIAEDAIPRLVNLESREIVKLKEFANLTDAQSSTDGKVMLFTGTTKTGEDKTAVYRPETGTYQWLPLQNATAVELTGDGQAVLYTQEPKFESLNLYDIATEKNHVIQTKHGMVKSLSYSGKSILSLYENNQLNLIDRTTRTLQTIPLGKKSAEIVNFGFVGKSDTRIFVQHRVEDQLYFSIFDTLSSSIHQHPIPFHATPFVSTDGSRVLFYFRDASVFQGGSYVVYDFKNISSLKRLGTLPRSNLKSFYETLAVPGAFKVDLHANAVARYFETGDYKKDRELTQRILLNVLTQSNAMFEGLIDRFLPGQGYFFDEAPLETLAPIWKKSIRQYMDYFMTARLHPTVIHKSLKYVRAIRNYLKPLSESDLATYAEALDLALVEAASKAYPNIFKSVLYPVCDEQISPLFWYPSQTVTKVTYVRSPNKLEPVILATEPINGDASTLTPFGFYMKRLKPVLIPENATTGWVAANNERIVWTQGPDQYVSVMNAVVKAPAMDRIVPTLKAPDYRRLWRDKSLTGMVVIGNNLVGEESSTIRNYRNYFREEGFEFEASEKTDAFRSVLIEKISSGEIDYFIKEAHADGDPQNVMRLNHSVRILKASRAARNGYREVVYIVIPSGNPHHNFLVTNEEAAELIRIRLAAGHPELVLFDETCWSIGEMIHLTENAFSKGIITIASTMPVDLFESTPKNAAYSILTGFRAGETFRKMRWRLRKNADYVHQTGNTFILPDEPAYREYLKNSMSPPLHFEQKIYKNGKQISTDH